MMRFRLCSRSDSLGRVLPVCIALGIAISTLAVPTAVLADDIATVNFRDDVQPILRRHCYRCHGQAEDEGGLRLHRSSGVVSAEADSGEAIVIPHKPAESLLIQRLIDSELGDLMPLDGEPLSAREIATLESWIDNGAIWDEVDSDGTHWAYQSVVRPEVPEDSAHLSAIDHFVDERLQNRGLDFSPMLDRPRLLRRVYLALTGLPPSPEQVSEFVADRSENAYERVVDSLLESHRYGERWAVPWLDLARYADSNGFQADQIRDNWAYRDWVIRAFNSGMPFDQFVIDQIAGDLRSDATLDNRVATGFHRMTTCNVEAGVHPEANRVNQVVDRVNTTATVFLGSTLECAQCHDHKYDPFTQKDYYQLFAYFNSTPLEVKNTSGVTWDFYGPKMDLPMEASQQESLASLQAEMTSLRQARKETARTSDAGYDEWIAGLRESGEVVWRDLIPESFESTGDETYEIEDDGAVLLSGSVPDTVEHIFTFKLSEFPVAAIRLDVLTDDSIPGKGPGRGDAKRTNIILNEFTCEVVRGTRSEAIELSDAAADFSQKNWDVANAIDGNRKSGWAISPQFGKPHWASFVLAKPLAVMDPSSRLRVTLSQFFGRGRVIGKPKLSVFVGDSNYLNIDAKFRRLANKAKLTKAEQKKLRAEFEENHPELRMIDRKIARLQKRLDELQPDTTLVMEELDQPRETFVMLRGEYENTAEKVQPDTPASLPMLDSATRRGDRMDLATWLTSRQNPLLSRVTVNRWWAELFGEGLVGTPEDFGTQGELPSHPELLDWLACELMDGGWSMKQVHKSIVMSRTFQQSSAVTPELMEIDPENRLLSRGPRFRLAAELVRDNSLAISGLLSTKMFGIPVMPYQPDNIWRSVGRNQPTWKAAESEDRFRRGVYVVWKRAAPYPSFINFDAPDRGSCTVRRGRSNTPLQALTLLNDPAFAEMALALADRILSESPSSDDASRIDYGVQLALARLATDQEKAILQELLESERELLRDNRTLVQARTQLPFDSMRLRSRQQQELAAWFAVANTLLNLDETMTQ